MKSAQSLSVLFLFLATFAAHSQTVPTNGLVGYYRFNTDANNSTGTSSNGVLNGSGISYTTDRFGSNNAAVHFAGGGYISISPTPINVNADYSVTFWIKLDNSNSTPYNFFSTGEDNLGALNIRVWPFKSNVGWAFIPFGPNGIDSLPPTNYTTWHAVACIHQGTNDFLYIDNLLLASGGHTNTSVDTGSIWLGRHQDPATYDLQGTMDDVRFYNRALSSNEISQLYVAEAPPANGLVGYYLFNSNAIDATGISHTGVQNGSGITYTADRYGSNNAAIHFAGGGYISISPTPIDVNADYSVAFWVKLDDASTIPYNLLSTAQDTFGGMNVRTYVNVFGWAFVAYDPGPTSTPPTNYTQWHSLVCIRQGTNDFMYIDNVLRTVGNHTNVNVDNGSIWLGRHQSSFFYDLHGAMDDLRFYNRALSSNEVGQLFATETAGLFRVATATAILTNGFVTGASIVDGGFGYTNVPIVRFIGASTTPAQGTAVVSNGMVVAINMSSAGSGYSSPPLIVIQPPVIPAPPLAIAPMSLLTFSNLATGSNYQLQLFHSDYWSNAPVSFTATAPVYTQLFAGFVDPAIYRLALTPAPTKAFATPQIVNGFVVGANITSGGYGYFSIPTVSIVGGSGSNAMAAAQIGNGQVTNIVIQNAGIGYSSAPTINIAPPPAGLGISPTLQPLIRIDASQLVPYDNYQIQFNQNLGASWSNYGGGLFMPTAATNSQFLPITNTAGFFRLQHLP